MFCQYKTAPKTIQFSRIAEVGLLRTSTSSQSWIFEPLVPVPKVVTDVLVNVDGLRGW